MSDIGIGSFDFEGLLGHLTNTPAGDWSETDGPDSGCGLDYWYVNKVTGVEAYLNLDQTFLSVSIGEDSLFAEELDDLDPGHEAARFFAFEPAPAP